MITHDDIDDTTEFFRDDRDSNVVTFTLGELLIIGDFHDKVMLSHSVRHKPHYSSEIGQYVFVVMCSPVASNFPDWLIAELSPQAHDCSITGEP